MASLPASSPSRFVVALRGLLLCGVPVLAVMGAVLMAPLLPRMHGEFASTPWVDTLVPMLMTVPALCLALCSPLAGRLCDKHGARGMLIGSLLLYAVTGVAPMFLTSPWLVLVSRLGVGVAEAGLVTSATMLLFGHFSGDDRQRWLAYQGIAIPVIVTLLVMGTAKVADTNWRATFLVYLISLVIALGVYFFVPDVPRGETAGDAKKGSFPPYKSVRLLTAVAVIGSIAFYAAPVEVGFLLAQIGNGEPSQIGKTISIGVLAGILGPLLSRRLTHLSFGTVLALAMGAMGGGLVLMSVGGTWATITAGMAIQQIGGALMITTGLTYTGSLSSTEDRGRYSGYWWFTYMLSQSVAPLFMTALHALVAQRTAAVAVCGLLVLATLALWLRARDLKRPVVASVPGQGKGTGSLVH